MGEGIYLKVAWEIHGLSRGTGRWLSPSFMVCWVRELFSATDSLFILSLHPPAGSQSITGDLEQERETQDQSSRMRQGGQRKCKDRAIVWKFIYAACWFVATHRETNVYGKLQKPPGSLGTVSIDFVMIFISVQTWLYLLEVILHFDHATDCNPNKGQWDVQMLLSSALFLV